MLKKPTYNELGRRVAELEKSKLKLKQRLAALRKSDDLLKTIFENAPVLIDAFDKNGRCILWNRQCQKVLGWTFEEINAHDDFLSEVYPDPDVADKVRQAILDGPDGQFQEWHPVTKDGRTLTTMWANFPLPDGTLIGLGYDLTDHRLSSEALQENEEEMRAILDAADETIALVDRLGTVIAINQTACDRLNQKKKELVGGVIYDFFPPEVAEKRKQRYETVFETGNAITFVDSA